MKQSMSLEKKQETVKIGLGLALLVSLGLAAYSLPSYADYCKESQAKCELNKEHSLMNIVNTLRQK